MLRPQGRFSDSEHLGLRPYFVRSAKAKLTAQHIELESRRGRCGGRLTADAETVERLRRECGPAFTGGGPQEKRPLPALTDRRSFQFFAPTPENGQLGNRRFPVAMTDPFANLSTLADAGLIDYRPSPSPTGGAHFPAAVS